MSLRWKLVLTTVGVAGISILVLGVLVWIPLREIVQNESYSFLQREASIVARQLTQTRGLDPQLIVQQAEHDTGTRILVIDRLHHTAYGDAQITNPGTALEVRRAGAGNGWIELAGQRYLSYSQGGTLRSGPLAIPGGAILVVASPQSSVNRKTTGELLPAALLAALAALTLATLAAVWISGSLTRDLRRVSQGARALAQGDYSHRVGLPGRGEVAALGRDFDAMADRVESSRQTQRDFLANVSHELRTPLTSLLGFSQALLDGSAESPEQAYRAAGIIHGEAERLLRLSQELVDLARVESGVLGLEFTAVDLGGVLRSLESRFSARLQASGLILVLRMDPGLPAVRADLDRLNQVLDNLAENAVRYAARSGAIALEAHRTSEGIEVWMENSLEQAPPDLEVLFERFYRGDASRRSSAGVGLGLALARQLAQAMGGHLWAETPVQGRIRFRLRLAGA